MNVASVAATPIRGRHRLAAGALLGLIALAACSTESPMAPEARVIPTQQPLRDVFTPPGGTLSVASCEGPAGTYSYHVDVQGGGAYILSSGADRTFIFATPLDCSTISYVYVPNTPSSWLPGAKAKVTVRQTSRPANTQVDSIRVYVNQPFDVVHLRNYATVEVGFNDNAITFFYMGHTPQGCGVGYWKQSSHYPTWTASGHAPTDLVGSVFAKSSLYTLNNKALSAYKFSDALAFGGGSSASGAAQLLLRAAVAAELNARRHGFGYPIPSGELVKSVDYALNSGNRAHMITLGIVLDILNNIGCPLK